MVLLLCLGERSVTPWPPPAIKPPDLHLCMLMVVVDFFLWEREHTLQEWGWWFASSLFPKYTRLVVAAPQLSKAAGNWEGFPSPLNKRLFSSQTMGETFRFSWPRNYCLFCCQTGKLEICIIYHLFLLMKVVHHFCPQKPAAKFWSKQQDPQVLSQVSKLPTFVEWMYYKKLVMAKLLATQFFLVLLLSFVAILGQVLIWGTPQLLGHYPAHKCCPINIHNSLFISVWIWKDHPLEKNSKGIMPLADGPPIFICSHVPINRELFTSTEVSRWRFFLERLETKLMDSPKVWEHPLSHAHMWLPLKRIRSLSGEPTHTGTSPATWNTQQCTKWGSVKCCHIGQSKPFWRALYHVHIFMSKISFILIKAQTSSKLRFTRH